MSVVYDQYLQRLDALTKANSIRQAQKLLCNEIAALPMRGGMARLAQAIDAGECDAMPVYRALRSPCKFGHTRATAILRTAGVISGDRRIRELSQRQRDLIVELLR